MFLKIASISLIFSAIIFAQNINDFSNRFMLGESYAQSGDFKKAKEIFEDLFQKNPDNFQIFDALNKVYTQLKEYNSSLQIIEKRLKKIPNDINLYGLLGTTYHLMGNEQKAFETWDKGLEITKDNPVFYRVIANYAIQRRAFNKGIEILKKGKTAAPDPLYFSYDLANLYTVTMQFKEAAQEYAYIIQEDPNQYRSVEGRILSYINKPDALKKTIEVFEDFSGGNEYSFAHLLARLYIENKNYSQAFDLYKKIDKAQNNKGVELFSFAQLLMSEGEYETASNAFKEVIEKYPDSQIISSAKLGYAKTLEKKFEKEVEEKIPAWKPYYTFTIENTDEAEEIINAYIELAKAYPQSEVGYEAYYRAGRIAYIFLKKEDQAKELLQKITLESPLSVYAADAFYLLGTIELENGDPEKATEFFNKILSSRGNEEQKNSAYYKIALVKFYQQDFNSAKENLAKILTNFKDNTANDALELSLLLNSNINDSSNLEIYSEAEFLAEQKMFEKASEKFELVAQNQNAFMLQNISRLKKAEMELALNNFEISIEMFNTIAAENEKNIYADKALYLLAQIYQFEKSDVQMAIETYERLLAKFPNSLYLDEAREQIIKLRNKLS